MKDEIVHRRRIPLGGLYCNSAREEKSTINFKLVTCQACLDVSMQESRDMERRVKDKELTVQRVEEAIGIPAQDWAGRCYEIAQRIVRAGLVQGRAVYGHWLGPIVEGTFFERMRTAGFCRHGWIALADGRKLDPTRWVFEGAEPYLWWSEPGEEDREEYDEGGNVMRERLRGPAPTWDAHLDNAKWSEEVTFHLSPKAWDLVEALIPLKDPARSAACVFSRRITLTNVQLHWLATCPPEVLGDHIVEIYEAIRAIGRPALIPVDNWRLVMES